MGNLCCHAGYSLKGRCYHKHKTFKLTVVVPTQLARGEEYGKGAEMAHPFYRGTQLARTHYYEEGCKMGISCVFQGEEEGKRHGFY